MMVIEQNYGNAMDETALQQIHQRLLEGDPTAPADLVELSGPVLCRHLRSKYRVADELIDEAVLDALFNLLNRPETYQPAKGKLSSYLVRSADFDLRNILQKERRQRPPSTVSLDAVADDDGDGNTPLVDRIEDKSIDVNHWIGGVDPVLLRTIREQLPAPADREVLRLMAEGERKTAAFAEVLGVTALDIEGQRRSVKQAKDRITMRLKRELKHQGWSDGH